MKRITELLKKFFNLTFTIYTCISFFFLLVAGALTINETPDTWSAIALQFSHFLLFSALTALFHTLVPALPKLHCAVANIISAVLTYGAFYLCFFALVKGDNQPVNLIVMSVLFFVAYALVRSIFAFFTFMINRKRNEREEYNSIYNKGNN